MSKLATIDKIGDFKTSPKLLLEMAIANFPDAESVAISIINDGEQYTFWTEMDNSSLAFHIYGIQSDLTRALNNE